MIGGSPTRQWPAARSRPTTARSWTAVTAVASSAGCSRTASRIAVQLVGPLSSASSVCPSVDFADDIDAVGGAINPRQTVKKNVVLREAFERGSHNPESDVAKNVHSRRAVLAAAESFLHQNLTEDIYLICADAARLIRIRHLKTEF
jgi:hypothetical protein